VYEGSSRRDGTDGDGKEISLGQPVVRRFDVARLKQNHTISNCGQSGLRVNLEKNQSGFNIKYVNMRVSAGRQRKAKPQF
jgi:hypothetical protein